MLKVGFQFGFGKVDTGELEEVVFEVIEVPEDAFAVEGRHRIADGPVHVECSFYLYMRELAYRAREHGYLVVGPAARFASVLDIVEE